MEWGDSQETEKQNANQPAIPERLIILDMSLFAQINLGFIRTGGLLANLFA